MTVRVPLQACGAGALVAHQTAAYAGDHLPLPHTCSVSDVVQNRDLNQSSMCALMCFNHRFLDLAFKTSQGTGQGRNACSNVYKYITHCCVTSSDFHALIDECCDQNTTNSISYLHVRHAPSNEAAMQNVNQPTVNRELSYCM